MTKSQDKDAFSAVLKDMAKHRQNSIIYDGTAGNEMMPPSSGFAQNTIAAARGFMAWVGKLLLSGMVLQKKICCNIYKRF
jgi:hypothetical protein